ncbi:phosphatidylinositol glycan anchor biosynthesis class B isoform X1 [Megalopta genalis]|uniref:phosphatidylinositol glycan anchor biosynthesis class B isoform X1 n=2 Tax=Megalopta genalis TaxID=115081 RepID=UPI003FCFB05D
MKLEDYENVQQKEHMLHITFVRLSTDYRLYEIYEMYLLKKYKTLSLLILWRLSSTFLVQTAHVPDEYWQSLEVAHRLAFGYGYLTWEWTLNVRNYLYPFLMSVIYRILALASLDYVTILIMVPRMIQAILSAYGEYRFYKWTQNKRTMYSLCINWYWYYCATRTLINTVETALTMIALSMFPWRDGHIRNLNFLWIVGFLCTMRPTAAILWLPLCIYHFCTNWKNKLTLIGQYSIIAIVCCTSSILLDSFFCNTLVVSPWEFFRVNVLYKIGDFYGTHHFLWYILCGLPVLLGLYYVVFFVCVWEIVKHPTYFHRQTVMLFTIVWTICVYSLLSHKEFRFLLPLLPMLIFICTSCTYRVDANSTRIERQIFVVLLLITNVVPGFYFSMIHQRGSLDVMNIMHKEITDTNDNKADILFLTPCHATPLYSHLHVNVSATILTCEPNFHHSKNYINEADTFFVNPARWLSHRYSEKENVTIPSHVITFDNVSPEISEFLENYRLLSKVFYSLHPQPNYGRYIHVYKRK